MFAIMIPVLLTPTIVLLFVMQKKAAKAGMVSAGASGLKRRGHTDEDLTFIQLARRSIVDVDLFGLILLGFAFALILLPFNLVAAASNGWRNPSSYHD